MHYMIVETFREGPGAVYERFRERGRLAPPELRYVTSWVTEDGRRCFQLMECDELSLLEQWMSNWNDLVDFDVVPVMSSADAAARFTPST